MAGSWASFHMSQSCSVGLLRAWMNRSGCRGRLAYWRTPSGSEVDFVFTRSGRNVGIEVKAASRWRRGDAAALAQLVAAKTVRRGYGVYLGRERLRQDGVLVLPLEDFLLRLVAGGLSNKAIGARLHLSHRTVERHVANLLTKTDTRDRQGLAVLAQQTGLD